MGAYAPSEDPTDPSPGARFLMNLVHYRDVKPSENTGIPGITLFHEAY